MTDKEIKQLAVDCVENKIFIADSSEKMVAFQVPLIFANIQNAKEISFIYEYFTQAGPLSINGFPSFLSFRIFKKENFEKFKEYFEQYSKLKNDFNND